ncbi:hypothetical protein M081_4104 [Bacteroides fragilis str. 3998 T(B) 4]|nr:hypothetical protein M081_4104 [Bacteroides fragilis str. 3998 T(B) 4]
MPVKITVFSVFHGNTGYVTGIRGFILCSAIIFITVNNSISSNFAT